MSEWLEIKLKEICKFKYGANLPASSRIKGNYPVYGSSGIVSHCIDYYVKGPGIIVGRKGTVGKVQYSPTDFFPIDTTFYIEHDLNKVDLKFLYYRLQISGLDTMNSDAAVPGLNRITAINQRIKLPPLPTQKKIAKILSNYDDLIESNIKSIKLLKQSARLTYEEWFLRFRINGNRLEINKDTGLPIGWQNVLLTEYIDLEKGVEPGSSNYEEVKTDQNVPFIRVGDLNKRESNIYVSKNLTKNKIVTEKDIMISLDGSPGKVKFGMNGCYSAGIRRAIPKHKNLSSIFILNLLNSQYIKKLIDAYSSGTTILHAGSSVKKMRFILPTDEVLDIYNNIEMKKFHLIINLLNKNKNLKEAKDILLPRIMTGMIDTDDMNIAV